MQDAATQTPEWPAWPYLTEWPVTPTGQTGSLSTRLAQLGTWFDSPGILSRDLLETADRTEPSLPAESATATPRLMVSEVPSMPGEHQHRDLNLDMATREVIPAGSPATLTSYVLPPIPVSPRTPPRTPSSPVIPSIPLPRTPPSRVVSPPLTATSPLTTASPPTARPLTAPPSLTRVPNLPSPTPPTPVLGPAPVNCPSPAPSLPPPFSSFALPLSASLAPKAASLPQLPPLAPVSPFLPFTVGKRLPSPLRVPSPLRLAHSPDMPLRPLGDPAVAGQGSMLVAPSMISRTLAPPVAVFTTAGSVTTTLVSVPETTVISPTPTRSSYLLGSPRVPLSIPRAVTVSPPTPRSPRISGNTPPLQTAPELVAQIEQYGPTVPNSSVPVVESPGLPAITGATATATASTTTTATATASEAHEDPGPPFITPTSTGVPATPPPTPVLPDPPAIIKLSPASPIQIPATVATPPRSSPLPTPSGLAPPSQSSSHPYPPTHASFLSTTPTPPKMLLPLPPPVSQLPPPPLVPRPPVAATMAALASPSLSLSFSTSPSVSPWVSESTLPSMTPPALAKLHANRVAAAHDAWLASQKTEHAALIAERKRPPIQDLQRRSSVVNSSVLPTARDLDPRPMTPTSTSLKDKRKSWPACKSPKDGPGRSMEDDSYGLASDTEEGDGTHKRLEHDTDERRLSRSHSQLSMRQRSLARARAHQYSPRPADLKNSVAGYRQTNGQTHARVNSRGYSHSQSSPIPPVPPLPVVPPYPILPSPVAPQGTHGTLPPTPTQRPVTMSPKPALGPVGPSRLALHHRPNGIPLKSLQFQRPIWVPPSTPKPSGLAVPATPEPPLSPNPDQLLASALDAELEASRTLIRALQAEQEGVESAISAIRDIVISLPAQLERHLRTKQGLGQAVEAVKVRVGRLEGRRVEVYVRAAEEELREEIGRVGMRRERMSGRDSIARSTSGIAMPIAMGHPGTRVGE